jgi:carboxypeptidase family protein
VFDGPNSGSLGQRPSPDRCDFIGSAIFGWHYSRHPMIFSESSRTRSRATRILAAAAVGVLGLFLSTFSQGQTGSTALSGTIVDSAGNPIPNAKVSVKSVASGQSTALQANSAGVYEVPGLIPGDYEVSASAEGFVANSTKVTLAADAREVVNLTLTGGLSLEDLGYAATQAQGNAVDQATLDKRSHMLKVHQTLGLIATVPLAATLITSSNASSKNSTSSNRNLHAALGGATAILYYTSAYYAIFAPKIPGTTTRGPIKVHKALAWVHGIGMILTPILGVLADEQRNRGEKVHGIASAHGAVAATTAIAYGAAILSVSLKL